VVKVMPALTIDAEDLARGIAILEESADAALAA
jgi:4-aminobutyrate aminotransferase-like enzyme